jgi:hypothetical protein
VRIDRRHLISSPSWSRGVHSPRRNRFP